MVRTFVKPSSFVIPGLFACKANDLPLIYTPFANFKVFVNIGSLFLPLKEEMMMFFSSFSEKQADNEVGLYCFMQQNSGGGRFQTTEPPVADDDERRRW
jgi:hypothetical protein